MFSARAERKQPPNGTTTACGKATGMIYAKKCA